MKKKYNQFEFDKYEKLAKEKLYGLRQNEIKDQKLPLYLIKPYSDYKKMLKKKKFNHGMALEIGAGTGNFTNLILKTNMNIIATDISPTSLKFLMHRYKGYKNLRTKIANMEDLPFKDNTFDIVCGVGFLSYGENMKTQKEIYRVLKKGGHFICVDSLNNNIIYIVNRVMNYINNKTSLSTIKKMPTKQLIQNYIKNFSKVEIKYYGSIIWLMPVISLLCGEKIASKILDKFDNFINVSSSAFRFLLIAQK